MQYLGHNCSKLCIVSLKFKFDWASCVLSDHPIHVQCTMGHRSCAILSPGAPSSAPLRLYLSALRILDTEAAQ